MITMSVEAAGAGEGTAWPEADPDCLDLSRHDGVFSPQKERIRQPAHLRFAFMLTLFVELIALRSHFGHFRFGY